MNRCMWDQQHQPIRTSKLACNVTGLQYDDAPDGCPNCGPRPGPCKEDYASEVEVLQAEVAIRDMAMLMLAPPEKVEEVLKLYREEPGQSHALAAMRKRQEELDQRFKDSVDMHSVRANIRDIYGDRLNEARHGNFNHALFTFIGLLDHENNQLRQQVADLTKERDLYEKNAKAAEKRVLEILDDLTKCMEQRDRARRGE